MTIQDEMEDTWFDEKLVTTMVHVSMCIPNVKKKREIMSNVLNIMKMIDEKKEKMDISMLELC